MLTRTDRRRFPILLAVIAALAMAMLFSPVQAQEGSAPDQPTGLEATATHDSVTLTWDDPQDDTITGYVVLRRIPAVDPQGHFNELVSDTGTDATTYTDDTVSAETRYTYRIKAINEHGTSERSRWSHIDVPAAPEAAEGDDPDGEGDGGGAPGGPGKKANVSEPSDGDCPGDINTTCEVDVGGSVAGNISSRTDFDWFRVDLEAGTRYQIDLEGAPTSRGTLPDPSLELRDKVGLFEADNESSGVGDNAREIYTPTATGTYYVRVGEVDGETGTYTLSVIVLGANGASEADTDFPETTATTGRVEVGASATGNIDRSFDQDWFRLDLEAGKTYQIDMKGEGGGTLDDPRLYDMRDSDGDEISGTENDDLDFDNDILDSQIIYTPTEAGAYYLVAAHAGRGTGTYTLSVRDITPDATLSALSVTGGGAELVTNFASDTYAYDASAAKGVGQVTVTLEKSDSDATVEYLDSSDADSTADGHQVTLVVGNTVIKVKVTAEDGTTTQTYTVTVTLAEGSLVSNIGQGSTETHQTTTARSQRFRAGSNEAGYILTGVDVVSGGTRPFTAKVCGVASNNNPTSTCTDLTPPDSFAAGTMSFSAPPNITLSKGTTYAVVLNLVESLMDYGRTTSEREDKGKQPGSSIANEFEYLGATDNWTENPAFSVRIAIKGTVILPTLSIAAAEGDEDDGVEFTATLTAAVSGKVTATWTASIESGDTASAADLATTKTGEVEFDENATEATFTVQVNDDTTVEEDETFTVTLSGVSSNAQLAADPTAKGTILDDDSEGSTVLVSNIEEIHESEFGLHDEQQLAQAFSIATGSGNYTLTSIEIPIVDNGIAAADIDSLSVSVWSTDSSGLPSASLHTLTNPGSITADTTATFNAQSGMTLTLEAGNTYAVVVRYDKTISDFANHPGWSKTGEYDQSGAVGWEIADENLASEVSDVQWFSSDLDVHRMRINGTAVGGDEPPCTLETGDIWCGVVTVGDIEYNNALFARGYINVTGLSGGGFEGETDIPVGSKTYTFTGIYVPVTGSFEDQLIFRMDADFTRSEKETLELHIDVDGTGSTWPMSEFADSTSEGQMIRAGEDFDWSSATTVTARLRPVPPVISVGDVTVTEGKRADFAVTLSRASAEAVTVWWVTTAEPSDTATPGEDFTAPNRTQLTFAANETTKTVSVTTIDDALDEDDETLKVRLAFPTNATLESGGQFEDGVATITDNDPTPTVTVADAAATEGDKVEFTVTLSAVSGRDVEVGYATSVATGDTAVSGTDFTAASGTLTILASDSTATGTVEVQTTEDDATESAETFTLTLSATKNVALGTPSTATGTINDADDANNPPSFATATATREVPENSGPGTDVGAVVTATDADNDRLTYSLEGTDAASFVMSPNTAQIMAKAGVTYNHEATKNSYSVTVKADDGNGGTDTIAVTINVTDVNEKSAKPDKPTLAKVTGSTTSLTATWTKPDLNGGPDITGYDLQYKESTESSWEDFAHTGTAVTTTITGLTADTSYQARVLAKNGETDSDWSDASDAVSTNAGTALPTLSIADAEGDEDDGVEFTATLTAGVSGKVTATWTASIESGDTASAADLATTKTGEVEFDENATEATFTVQVNDDTTDEPDQTFTVTLSGVSSNAQLATDPTATGTIDDDDPAPTMDVADATASEGDNLEFAVTLSAASEKTVMMSWARTIETDDTAEAADFGSSGSFDLTFDPGETEQTMVQGTVDDALDEDAETFTMSVYQLTNASSGDLVATGTITDNDPTPTVTVADAAATEGDKVEFTVTLSAVSGRDVEVDYATSVATDDTAVSGTDFTAATGTLTILASDSTATGTVEVQTTEDDATESAETFTVTLSNPSNATISDATAKGTILDDDDATNAAPSISSSATFNAEENQTTVGTVLAMDSDSEDAITGYTITGGADQDFFSIGATSGALTFDAAPNFEDPKDSGTDNDYVVTVQATSGTGSRVKTATQTITVTVTDVSGEAPGKPGAPTVSSASATSLSVNWSAPDNAGPAITDYDVRYREGNSGGWTDGSHNGTATTATLTGLSENTSYQVQVRAKNAEGTGAWSDSGSGTPLDDLPAGTTTNGVVGVGGSAARSDIHEPEAETATWIDDDDEVQEQIVYTFDTDWFAVELEEGQTYRIDMKGAIHDDDDDLTLRLPQINAIYNEDGEFLVNTFDSDESDSHYLFRVTFHAYDDGTYYIAASGESHEWGTYELRVKDIRDITEDDDGHTAAQRGLKNLRAVEEKGGVRLTWQPPDGAAVTGYRIERRRAGGQDSGPQRSHGQPRDHHTLVEDTGNTETSYVDESAEQGVEYEYRVTARNESGPGEGSDWVRAGPASASNNPATGAPTISGTTQVGETLTADISGIADADGLSGETFTYQWVSSDGTTDTDIENATGSTYKLVDADQGKSVKVRVTFTDDAGNAETLTSTPTGPVLGDGPPGAPVNLAATAGNKEVTLSWDPPDDNGNAPATRYRIEWRVDGKDYDKNHWGTARSTTYTTNDQANLANGVKYFFRVKAGNGDGNSQGPYGPASEEVSATPTSGSAVDLGTPVLSNTENLHHGMVRLDWEDIEDAGWYVVQYYHVKGGEWLDLPAEGVDIAFHGSSAVVSNLHGLSWLRVGAASCDGASEWSQIEELYGTKESDWEGVPVPEVEAGDEIEPCPVVLGTPVLSETEDLHHGMVQLDWQDIEDAGWYVVQYYHIDGGGGEWLDLPAAGVDIAFHGTSAVVSNLHGLSWLRVRAMSCAGASEWSQIEQLFGTNASDWEGVPVPEVAEGDEIEPCDEDPDTPDNSPATGAPTISGTAQVGETLTANTSGIADADGRTNATFSYQWLADDADINGATGSTYTLADSDEGKAAKVRVSFTDDAGNHETLTSEATDAVAAATQTNSPVIGAPTISGTAQVGETLTANTSGIADADGLSNVQYEYQWLADDADISGATNATYTLVAEDEGKAIKVQVSFTDDEGNEESLTSGATDVVVARPNSPATGAPTIGGTAQVGQTLTADTSGITDADGLANATFSYQWTADDTDISGATGLTYTLTGSEESKAITVQVSFTDDADNEETLTSAATDVVAGAQPTEPPDQPTGLDATATHDSVTLTWDDPGDDSITGYVILRRVPGVDPEGQFSELVSNTGTDATTYTDDTVSAETRYTYRIKAINEHGVSERSRWSHINVPAAP